MSTFLPSIQQVLDWSVLLFNWSVKEALEVCPLALKPWGLAIVECSLECHLLFHMDERMGSLWVIKAVCNDAVRKAMLRSTRDPIREPIREPNRESICESIRELMRDPMRRSYVREPKRFIREAIRQPLPQFKAIFEAVQGDPQNDTCAHNFEPTLDTGPCDDTREQINSKTSKVLGQLCIPPSGIFRRALESARYRIPPGFPMHSVSDQVC
eukprot:1393772-Amorphochlora_amoeboformis.AAC.2